MQRLRAGHRERDLIGRDAACRQIDAVVEGARGLDRGLLVIRGEAGAGKSALLAHAEERAGEMQVLRATGVRGDADVPFAGLLEVALPLIDLVDELPQPQRDALSVALARARLMRPLDRFAIGAGVLSLLGTAARRTGIVVLIDDLQWLDVASAEAIVFAARRLADSRAAFLFAVRDGERVPADITGISVIVAERLDRAATATLASRVRGTPVTTELAERIFAVTGGNPLAIAELRDRDGPALPIGAAPVSQAIEDEFAARAAALSPGARTALLVVAADDAVSATTHHAALASLGVDAPALDEAVGAGLLVRSQPRLAFRHPLVRSAIFQQATPGERRSVHAALADSLSADADRVRRTLHRAAAADAPDAELAAALERIGEEAFARHAYVAAALAYEQSSALTPADVATDARLFGAAASRYRSGDADAARASVAAALAVCRTPDLHADLIELQGQILWRAGESTAALDLLVAEARRVAPRDLDRADALLACAFAVPERVGRGPRLGAGERLHRGRRLELERAPELALQLLRHEPLQAAPRSTRCVSRPRPPTPRPCRAAPRAAPPGSRAPAPRAARRSGAHRAGAAPWRAGGRRRAAGGT